MSRARRNRPHPHAAGTQMRPPQEPLTLSVVIPAWNAEDFIGECIASLLDRAPDDLEIIVVDDGSTDATGAIAEQCAADDGRVRVLHQANALTAAARNAGLQAARGTYVGFVDDDDVVEPGWARTLLAAAARRHPAIVKGELRKFRDGRELLPRPESCRFMAANTPLHWFSNVWSAIYRRDFVLGHGLHFAPEYYSDDADFQVRAVVAALLDHERIELCPQAVYRYLRRADSTDSFRLSSRKIACALTTYRGLHELLCTHAAQLPPSGIGLQYFTWIRNLLNMPRRAERAEDGREALALARILTDECPVPGELNQLLREACTAAVKCSGAGGGMTPPAPLPETDHTG